MLSFTVPSEIQGVKDASRKISEYLNDLNLDSTARFNLKLCCEEAIINAIKHGNADKPELLVSISVRKEPQYIEITVKDQGPGFDFRNIADPTQKENLLKLSGRGLYIIENLMDEVEFSDNGSCIRMRRFMQPRS